MEFWQGFLGLSVLASFFLLWPTLFTKAKLRASVGDDERGEANARVFQDHLEDLEATRDRGEIEAQEFTSLKSDLEKTFVSENEAFRSESEQPIVASFRSRIPVIVLVFTVPLVALLVYYQIGAKADWQIHELSQSLMLEQDADKLSQGRAELISKLQNRLDKKPGNAQNWYLLATVAMHQGVYDESVRAYRKLLELEPSSARVMAELAQALFLRAGNTITPEVRNFTQQALSLDSGMPTALGLAGIDAFQSGEYEQAITHWQKAVHMLDPQSVSSQVFAQGIASAKLALEQQGKDVPEDTNKVENGVSVAVRVSIDKSILNNGDIDPSDTVFIYARAWQGPKMPLAIHRILVSELPKKVTLDNSMSMAQGMDMSSFPQIEIVARVSKTGSAVGQAGDWQATAGPVILGDQKKPVKLTIKEQIP